MSGRPKRSAERPVGGAMGPSAVLQAAIARRAHTTLIGRDMLTSSTRWAVKSIARALLPPRAAVGAAPASPYPAGSCRARCGLYRRSPARARHRSPTGPGRPARAPAKASLFHGDRDAHPEDDVRLAIALVQADGSAGERNVVVVVRLREEGAGQGRHLIGHAGFQGRGTARRQGLRPEGDVMRAA